MKTEKEERYMTLPVFYIVLSAIPFFLVFIKLFDEMVMVTEGQESNTIFTNNQHIFLYSSKEIFKFLVLPIFLTVVSLFFMRWMNKQMFGGLFDFLASIVMVVILFCSGMVLSFVITTNLINLLIYLGSSHYADYFSIVAVFLIMAFYWLGIPFLSVYQLKRK